MYFYFLPGFSFRAHDNPNNFVKPIKGDWEESSQVVADDPENMQDKAFGPAPQNPLFQWTRNILAQIRQTFEPTLNYTKKMEVVI